MPKYISQLVYLGTFIAMLLIVTLVFTCILFVERIPYIEAYKLASNNSIAQFEHKILDITIVPYSKFFYVHDFKRIDITYNITYLGEFYEEIKSDPYNKLLLPGAKQHIILFNTQEEAEKYIHHYYGGYFYDSICNYGINCTDGDIYLQKFVNAQGYMSLEDLYFEEQKFIVIISILLAAMVVGSAFWIYIYFCD